jgi:hypothetical protein
MHQRSLGSAALAVLTAALLLGAGMPALAQGTSSPSPTVPGATSTPSQPGSNVGASASDPVATVNSLLDIVIGRRFDQVVAYACAASAADLNSHLNIGAALAPTLPPGIDVQGLIDTMTLSIPDRSLTLVSKDASNATVNVKGTLNVDVDEEAMRPWAKELLVAAGEDSSDASVESAIGTIAKSLEVTRDMSRDVTLTVEGGRWLICDTTLGASPSP